MFVVKPFGLPHLASSALAPLTSPFLFALKLYGSALVAPGRIGGIRLVPITPPYEPPKARTKPSWSAASSTALRQSMLSNGATSLLIVVYQRRGSGARSVRAFIAGLLTIWACVSL